MTKRKLKETGPTGIEAKTKLYARKKGCYVRKFSSMSNPGVPDDVFVTPSGLTFFIEFKSPGKKPTHRQEDNLQQIIYHNGNAFVVDNLDEPGVNVWHKDFTADIQIWHDGHALIDMMVNL